MGEKVGLDSACIHLHLLMSEILENSCDSDPQGLIVPVSHLLPLKRTLEVCWISG